VEVQEENMGAGSSGPEEGTIVHKLSPYRGSLCFFLSLIIIEFFFKVF